MQGEEPSAVVTQMEKPALWKYIPLLHKSGEDQTESWEKKVKMLIILKAHKSVGYVGDKH